jgi:hypothetical protein
MKKFLLIYLSIVLSLSTLCFFGCKKQEDNVLVFPNPEYCVGVIDEKVDDTTLIVTFSSSYVPYGKTVYVDYYKASDFCVGDRIEIYYDKVKIPKNSAEYCTLTATNVRYYQSPAFKPIIYLYPTVETKVSVSLTLNGKFTCTYPDYDVNGWQNFTAKPDGTLIFPDGKEYYALYWEGVLNTNYDLSLGWCVKGSDTAKFLEWALSEQGLTPREANEFIIYWLPLMQDNAYNVISFQTDDYVNNAVLNVTPKPDSVLRVFMAYYPTDSFVEIAPQTFDGFTRTGFTVVEWGGTKVK